MFPHIGIQMNPRYAFRLSRSFNVVQGAQNMIEPIHYHIFDQEKLSHTVTQSVQRPCI